MWFFTVCSDKPNGCDLFVAETATDHFHQLLLPAGQSKLLLDKKEREGGSLSWATQPRRATGTVQVQTAQLSQPNRRGDIRRNILSR